MSVLFMLPDWRAYSEAWMQRMIEALEPKVSGVMAWHTEGEKRWRGRIPAIPLQRRSLMRRGLREFGVKLPGGTPPEILRHEIDSGRHTRVLCNYGHFAARFMDVWQATQIPLFIHVHGADVTFDLRKHDAPGQPVHPPEYREQFLKLAERAKFIATTDFVKRSLIAAGVHAASIEVKPLGVPLYPAKQHAPRDEIHILAVGRLVDFKSPDRTIMAFETACKQGLRARLTIAGDGPLRATCELLRARSPFGEKIKLLGPVAPAQIPELLAEADIFTQHNIKGELSRQEEAYGVSILEAMAAGLPVVGTRSGGVSETARHGVTGLLCEPGDAAGQAAALAELAGDAGLRARLGQAGRDRVAQCFSPAQEREALPRILGLGTG